MACSACTVESIWEVVLTGKIVELRWSWRQKSSTISDVWCPRGMFRCTKGCLGSWEVPSNCKSVRMARFILVLFVDIYLWKQNIMNKTIKKHIEKELHNTWHSIKIASKKTSKNHGGFSPTPFVFGRSHRSLTWLTPDRASLSLAKMARATAICILAAAPRLKQHAFHVEPWAILWYVGPCFFGARSCKIVMCLQ